MSMTITLHQLESCYAAVAATRTDNKPKYVRVSGEVYDTILSNFHQSAELDDVAELDDASGFLPVGIHRGLHWNDAIMFADHGIPDGVLAFELENGQEILRWLQE